METVAAEPSATKTPFEKFAPAGLIAIGWAAILITSDLDSIIAHVLGTLSPGWLPVAKAGVLGILAVSVRLTIRNLYLERFIWALAALVGGDYVATSIQVRVGWFQSASHAGRMFAGVFLSFIPVLLGALTLYHGRLSRHDLFLAVGDLRAETGLPFLRRRRWNVIAPILLAVISSTLLIQLWIVSKASRHFLPSVLIAGLLPAIVFATLNAFSEEFRFRCLLLAHGSQFMGLAQTIAATSVLFGLAHFGGHPSGFSGVAMAAFFAWVVARSMVDTGGLGWAWSLHFVQDVIIFLMVVMTGV